MVGVTYKVHTQYEHTESTVRWHKWVFNKPIMGRQGALLAILHSRCLCHSKLHSAEHGSGSHKEEVVGENGKDLPASAKRLPWRTSRADGRAMLDG